MVYTINGKLRFRSTDAVKQVKDELNNNGNEDKKEKKCA